MDEIEEHIEALKDEDENVRYSAAKALRWIGDERAVEPLIEALKDEDENVRYSAAKALGLMDSISVEPLIEALKDEDVRGYAAYALGWIGDKRAVEPLIEALNDDDGNVRRYAAKALGRIRDSWRVEPLIEALKDEDEDVRRYAAFALPWKRDERAVEPLIEVLKDENEDVRDFAAKALGRIGDKRAVEPLIEALKDEDEGVRSSVAEALTRIKHEMERIAQQIRDDKRNVEREKFLDDIGFSSGDIEILAQQSIDNNRARTQQKKEKLEKDKLDLESAIATAMMAKGDFESNFHESRTIAVHAFANPVLFRQEVTNLVNNWSEVSATITTEFDPAEITDDELKKLASIITESLVELQTLFMIPVDELFSAISIKIKIDIVNIFVAYRVGSPSTFDQRRRKKNELDAKIQALEKEKQDLEY
jgi:HEAT repeat protein